MLKITINNEEVVSNKDFTIEEEMLNTSSVILNNVYPKSWENDKDYVSRFYHPNDYSKCLIKDEDYTPAEPGLNEEGTSFQITADTTKLNELTSMKGNTSQSGTPTPTAPQPINVVSGRQDVVVEGKNILPQDKYIATQTINGIEYTNNGNGTFNLIGTATANTTIQIIPTGNISLEANQPYYLYSSQAYNGTTFNLSIPMTDNGSTKFLLANGTYTPTSTPTNVRLQFYIGNGQSVNATNVKLMLVKGNTAPTSYEAYKGNTYEINLGKNLLKFSNELNASRSMFTYTTETQELVVCNKNASGSNFYARYETYVEQGQTYTISIEDTSSRTFYCYSNELWGTAVSGLSNKNVSKTVPFTFTSSYTGKMVIGFYGNYNNNPQILTKPMLEKGSQATTYAPYKTPIELCKIGNYQDRIYKNGNKWYLEKKIGKVVFNGSENINTNSGYIANGRFDFFTITNGLKGSSGNPNCLSNYYKSNFSTNNGSIFLSGVDAHINIINIDYANDVSGFKTWLSTHNTSVYYVQATTTTTEITDSELISQLNSIELLEGLNNVSVVSPYLQGIINIHYNYVNETTTSDLLFCGVVKNSGNISLNPRHPHYQTLQILDFKTFLSEGETLDFVIANKTIEEAIDQVVDTISPYGFIKGNIEILGAETIIGAYSTKDKTAYDVFNYLADITQSRWTTRLIDENTVAIDFYDPTLLPRGETIQYNETWFRNNLIDDISYSYGSNDYRNKQVMTSKEVIGELEQVQIVYANGYQTQFMTEIKIAQINEIDVNGEPKTYATEDDKELGVEADFYYSIGNNIIESADTYPTGAVITIRYLPIVEGRQIITNNDEIDRVSTATGRKGVVARYEDRNDAITSNELQLIGQSYIRYKGVPEIKLNVQTRSNLWNIGDRVQFNAPITELATEYMVKKKTINRILANPDSEEHIVYTFELTSSFNSEQAINYFDNQRAKSKGNIGEGEAISRNIDIENETNIIFYDSNIVEITVVGDNVLNSTLNSPLNN